MSPLPDALHGLASGRYRGEGINHDQQPFVGVLELKTLLGGCGRSIHFTATGTEGTVYHEEETILGLGAAQGGAEGPVLVSLSTNDPRVNTYPLRREETRDEVHTYVFGLGDPKDTAGYRCEISLDLYPNGDLGYRYAWGLPGGEFAERSGVRLRREQHER